MYTVITYRSDHEPRRFSAVLYNEDARTAVVVHMSPPEVAQMKPLEGIVRMRLQQARTQDVDTKTALWLLADRMGHHIVRLTRGFADLVDAEASLLALEESRWMHRVAIRPDPRAR